MAEPPLFRAGKASNVPKNSLILLELSRNLTIKDRANESEGQYQENASRRRISLSNRLKLVLKHP